MDAIARRQSEQAILARQRAMALERQVRLETGTASLEDLLEESKNYSSPEEFRNRWRHVYADEIIGTASSIRDQVFEALNARAGGRGRGRDTAWQLPSGLCVRFGRPSTPK